LVKINKTSNAHSNGNGLFKLKTQLIKLLKTGDRDLNLMYL